MAALAPSTARAAAIQPRVAIGGRSAAELGSVAIQSHVAASTRIDVTIGLPTPNRAAIAYAVAQIYDPKSPLYHHFMTPETFGAQFGPSVSDYNAVISWARANGMKVEETFKSRLMVVVSGQAATVEKAFNVHLGNYAVNGRTIQLPDKTPTVPASIAPKIAAVQGLDSSVLAVSNASQVNPLIPRAASSFGTGHNTGLSPTDINTAYNIAPLGMDGSGQTVALYELDNYNPSDILGYEAYYGITNADIEDINYLNYADPPSTYNAQGEVTLDIELVLAVAPRAKVLVYKGRNGFDTFALWAKIANDNLAKSISTSWATLEQTLWEPTEQTTFMQLAAQGQTVYAASGDSGAYNYSSWTFDPATDPYVCGVGGTQLTLGSGSSYGSETTWSGSGGGLSGYWLSVPSWQTGYGSSSSARNVPDVSLNASGSYFDIYMRGSWGIWEGTSCSAPVWAGYNALIDQQLASSGQQPLGLAMPPLYTIAKGSNYASDFHDITTGNNQHYNAITGYDDATGWGSPNGVNLLTDLTSYSSSAAPGAPQGVVASGSPSTVTLKWGKVYGATTYNVYRGTSTGAESMTPIVTGLTNPTYSNSGLTNNQNYYFKVAAVNSNGTGSLSPEAVGYPGGLPPFAPTNLAFTVDRDVVNLSWTQAVGCGYYDIFRGDMTNGEAWAPIATVSGASTTYTDHNVENYIHYFYKVAGRNASGTGPKSNEVNASPGDHPFGQDPLTITGTMSRAVLSWDAGFYATTFVVYRGTTPGGEDPAPIATGITSPTYTDNTIVNGNTYYYTVAGVNT